VSASGEKWRLFVAIPVAAEIKARLAAVQTELRQHLSPDVATWTRVNDIHLTLRFLGDVSVASLGALQEALQRSCAGVPPFKLGASGLGCFPDPRRARVLWIGLTGTPGPLRQLQQRIESETADWGKTEERPFHPHLTLARIKRCGPREGSVLQELCQRQQEILVGEWHVSQVDLMRSRLSAEGADYSCVAQVQLTGVN
jgi:2'-5' RNA ligase